MAAGAEVTEPVGVIEIDCAKVIELVQGLPELPVATTPLVEPLCMVETSSTSFLPLVDSSSSDSESEAISPRVSAALPPRPYGPPGMRRCYSALKFSAERARSAYQQVEALGTTEGSSSNLERVAEAPVDGAAVTVDYVPILRSGICADVGPRSYMEDAHVLVDDITGSLGGIELAQPSAFYGVYDGHMGLGAAKYVQDHILRLVVQDPAFPDEMAAAMKGAYVRADEDLESHWAENREGACSGTTALSVLITGRTAVVANTGDCRAVLSRKGKAIELSTDQKATSIGELARIQAAGGYVQDEYLNGQLGVARALGDWHMEDLKRRDEKAQLAGPLIPVPEVRELELNPDDEFLIIGSDGLWDKFDSQIAISFARKRLQQHNDPQQCSKELVAEAIRLDAVDNLTVVLVCFMETPPPQLKPIVKRSISVDGFQRLQGHIDTAGCSGW